MTNRLIKTIRIIIWVCISFCIISLCYSLNGAVRWSGVEITQSAVISLLTVKIALSAISMFLIVIFLTKVLVALRQGRFFVKNNYRFILALSACFFMQPWIDLLFDNLIKHKDMFEQGGLFVPYAILRPVATESYALVFIMIIFGLLYRVGELVSEEQELTV